MSKIIIRMSGGLGNQMFQYALYVKLRALGHGAAFDDETEYNAKRETDVIGNSRPKMLGIFGIDYPKAEQTEITELLDADLSLSSKIRRKCKGRQSLEMQDEDFVFDPKFLETEKGYFAGCFQSAKYFEGVEDKVREAFTFPESVEHETHDAENYAVQIREASREGGSCAIHLRFGDYLDKADVYGGICTEKYYRSGIAYLKERYPKLHFFVFSNDSKRASAFIHGDTDFTLVEGNDEDHGYLDLYLMTLCDHFIIANSSFSWWGAWLGTCKEKKVIAPGLWMWQKDGSELKRADIYTDDMIRIGTDGEIESALPLVSVIVAAYNIEQYIDAALISLENQTLQNLEIIAVDDGSTDRTGAIIDAHAAKDSRIIPIHKKNGGLSDARNAGLKVAKGDYIGYLDGDDLARPQMYESMVRACVRSGARVAVVRYETIRESERSVGKDRKEEAGSVDGILRASVLLKDLSALDIYLSKSLSSDEDGDIVFYNSVWSKLFRKDLVEDLQFPVGKNSEDIMYTTKALERADRVAYLPERLYLYLQDRTDSIMNVKLGERRFEDELPFWEEQIAYLREKKKESLAQKAEYYYFRRLLYYYEDFCRSEEYAPYKARMEEKIRDNKRQIKAAAKRAGYAGFGDRMRLLLFANSPKLYRKVAEAYLYIHRN